MRQILLIALATFLGAANGITQDFLKPLGDPRWRVTFQVDNDVFLGQPSDRDYTNGLHLGVTYRLLDDTPTPFEEAMLSVTGGSPESLMHPLTNLDPSGLELDLGLSLTQLMFTPTDSSARVAPPGQRPFAGWLGLGIAAHAKSQNAISSFAITLGVTGEESLAQEAQDFVHDIGGVDRFRGWPSQVPTEVTLNLHLDRKWRLGFLDGVGCLDGYFEYGGLLGNFRTSAYAGGLLRFGFNLPESYPTPRLDIATSSHRLFTEKGFDENWSLYLFAGGRIHGVLHDITLDGPIFRNHHHSVDSEPLVGEFTYGLGARYDSFELIVSTSIRSDEFKGQRENHEYGSVMLRFTF